MMLRKRNRSHHKDQRMGNLTISDTGSDSSFQSDATGHNPRINSLFSIPGLFVGLSHKGVSDSDSARSPTSPLDFRVFSNVGQSLRSPRSPLKSWDCSKVGLSIVDSLDDEMKESGKILQSWENKNILFGSQMRTKTASCQNHINSLEAPKSLPRNFAIFPHNQTKSRLQEGNSDVLFEIGEAPLDPEPFGKMWSSSLDSCRSLPVQSVLTDRKPNYGSRSFCSNTVTLVNSPPPLFGGSPNSNNFSRTNLNLTSMSIGSSNGFMGLSASEIELSEDYTCVISHGSNPKTTHIYGDCILECHSSDFSNFAKNEEKEIGLPQTFRVPTIPSPFPSNDFLSFCYSCKKKLEDGKDIYIYRGEKAFCSLGCRAQEIMIDEDLEEMEIIDKSSKDSPKSDNCGELFETGIFAAA